VSYLRLAQVPLEKLERSGGLSGGRDGHFGPPDLVRGIEPRFCFGHGLSYTSFALASPQASSSTFEPGDALFFDAAALHGPEELTKLPMTYLSIIIYPRS